MAASAVAAAAAGTALAPLALGMSLEADWCRLPEFRGIVLRLKHPLLGGMPHILALFESYLAEDSSKPADQGSHAPNAVSIPNAGELLISAFRRQSRALCTVEL